MAFMSSRCTSVPICPATSLSSSLVAILDSGDWVLDRHQAFLSALRGEGVRMVQLLQSTRSPAFPSDQFRISPAPHQKYYIGIKPWLFIAYSDERWLYYEFSLLSHLYVSLVRVGRMYFSNLGVKGLIAVSSLLRPLFLVLLGKPSSHFLINLVPRALVVLRACP